MSDDALDPDDDSGILLEDYPQLRAISWHLRPGAKVSARDALALYERNWYLVDVDRLCDREKELIQSLVKAIGGGVFHV